jgi:hypothetical protein
MPLRFNLGVDLGDFSRRITSNERRLTFDQNSLSFRLVLIADNCFPINDTGSAAQPR